MQTTLNITLIILGGLTAAVILCAIGVGILAIYDTIFSRYFAKGQQAQWETDSRRIRDMAHWFSEDPPTQKLIQLLAERSDVSYIRDEWRRAREKNNQTKGEGA